MEAWKMSRNSIFVRYYYWIYDYYPLDICEYIKRLILAILFSVFMIPVRIVSKDDYTIIGLILRGIGIWILVLLFAGVGVGFLVDAYPNLKEMNIFLLLLLGFITLALFFATIILILAGIGYLGMILYERRTFSDPINNIKDKIVNTKAIHNTLDAYHTYKEKHCAKIDWID